MSTTKRMIADVDRIESLLKEVVYNKDANTLEIGGNVYVDGKEQMHDLGNGVYVKELHGDMALFYAKYEDSHYYGIGYINEYAIRGVGFTDYSDTVGRVEIELSPLTLDYYQLADMDYAQQKLYEHQLTISTAAVNFYINYYSTNRLVIDSLQDLTTVVKPNADTKIGLASTYMKYESNVWKLASGDLITAVADNVVVVD